MVTHPSLHHLSEMSVLFRMGGLLSVIAGAVALFMSMGCLLKIEEMSGFLMLLESRWKRFREVRKVKKLRYIKGSIRF